MSRKRIAFVLAASLPFAFFVGSVAPVGELGLVAALVVFVWAGRAVPGFAGGAFRGAAAGALAGVVVMGVGFRMAMRVVAITDPTRSPEFTVGGTAFILVGIGLMLGTFAGAYLSGLRQLLGLRTISVALLATAVIIPLLFGDSETRAELFDLGLGAWVNIPMFTSIVFAYGWAQDVWTRRLDRRVERKRAVAGVAEPAPVP